jgi:hypothetical protein
LRQTYCVHIVLLYLCVCVCVWNLEVPHRRHFCDLKSYMNTYVGAFTMYRHAHLQWFVSYFHQTATQRTFSHVRHVSTLHSTITFPERNFRISRTSRPTTLHHFATLKLVALVSLPHRIVTAACRKFNGPLQFPVTPLSSYEISW